MQQLTQERATCVSMASDGSCVVAAITAEDVVLLLPTNGKRQFWHCASLEPTVVATNSDGSKVAVGSATGIISIRGTRGELISQFAIDGCLSGLGLDSTGSYLAATTSDKPALQFFSTDASLKWSKPLLEPSLRVAISDGGDIVGCADARRARLISRDGSELIAADFSEPIYAVALTQDGSYLVAGCRDGIKCLKTSLGVNAASNSDSNAIAEKLITEIRSRYLNFSADGLCCWFREFDQCLEQKMYVVCDALFEEIDGGGYEMDATEVEYVNSRRGALALSRGISYELKKEFDKADKCYAEALEFQIACGNREGEGQVRALAVRKGETRPEESLALQFHEQLKVIGSAEACLTHRIATASPPELLKIIHTAKDAGYIEPIFAALANEEHPSVAGNAAAALAYLEPGASIDQLLEYLNHANWFVRWRASDLVLRFLSIYGLSSEIHESVTVALARETDPDVRRELLRLVAEGAGGNADLSETLSPLLKDPDPDVRFLACKALSQCGRRSVLAALDRVEEGQTFFGDYVSSAAEEAYESIDLNDPELLVESVYLYSRQTDPLDQVEAHLFLQNESVICGLIRVKNFQRHIRFNVSQDSDDESLFLLNIHSNYGDEAIGESAFNRQGLVEYYMRDGATDLLKFTLSRPLEGWQAGENTLYVYFNDDYVSEYTFEIVDSIAFEHCVLSAATSFAGVLINPATVFAAHTPHMFCQVVLTKNTAGMPVELRVFDDKGNLLRKDHRLTNQEGRERLVFSWVADTLKVGRYIVEIKAGDLGNCLCNFRIIDGTRIVDAGMYSYVDWAGSVRSPRSLYHPDEDFVLSAELIAAPGSIISTELRWQGKPIFNAPVTCSTRALPEQVATVVYRRPTTDWPTGDYDITISADSVPVHSIEFQVKPVSITQRIGALTHRTSDLFKSEGKAVGKSALIWGVTFPATAIVLFLMNELLRVLVGENVIRGTWLLVAGHRLGATGLMWWLVLGLILGIYQSVGKNLLPWRFYRIPRVVLIFVVEAIICQQATYIIFSPGYLWPDAFGQLFSKVLYAAPLLAWLGVIMCLGFINNDGGYRERAWAFPIETCLLIVLAFAFYISGLVSSILFGLTGWLLLLPLNTHWAAAAWSAGVYFGFAAGLVALFGLGRVKPRRDQ